MDTGDTMSTDASKKPRLSGIFSPTVTAFTRDESLNPERHASLCPFPAGARCGRSDPAGKCGRTGSAEHRRENEGAGCDCGGSGGGRIPIYAGTSDYSTATTIELSFHAKSAGCDGLMLMAPYLLKAAEAGRTEPFSAHPRKGRIADHGLQRAGADGHRDYAGRDPDAGRGGCGPRREVVAHGDCQGAGHATALRTGVLRFSPASTSSHSQHWQSVRTAGSAGCR